MPSIKPNDFITESKLRGAEISRAFNNVLSSGWYILGKEVTDFENKFAKYLGTKHCIGVANGLEALQISLMSLGITTGDEVITTPLSAVATTLAILAVGAKPIFVDIDGTGNLDPSKLEKVITKNAKAVIPVHLYGQPCNLSAIKRICDKNQLYLIEDACQAHGSTYKGKKLGTIGDLGCFSFYPTKNMGAIGDGGAIVTNNQKLATICRQIRDYGQSSKYIHDQYGLNSRLDEVQAAILKIKLKYLDKDNSKRRSLAKKYILNLKSIKDVQVITQNLENSNFHQFVILTKLRNELQKYLSEQSIHALIHYPLSIPEQKFITKTYNLPEYPLAKEFSRQVLSLPCHQFMSTKDIDYVTGHIAAFFMKNS